MSCDANFVVDYTNERTYEQKEKKHYIPVDIKSSKSSIFSGGRFKDNAFVTY